jgi:hypothetical protein
MTNGERLLGRIAAAVDRRRLSLTEVARVLLEHQGHVLRNTVCSMALPLVYAHWEGFVKEAFEEYVEFLEHEGILHRELSPILLAYAWTPAFRKLATNQSIQKQTEIASLFLSRLDQTVRFDAQQKAIDTKSNLRFEVFQELAAILCLDVSSASEDQKKLNALVNRRNQIAHGGRGPGPDSETVLDYIDLVLDLMVAVERSISDALLKRPFVLGR